MKTAHELAIRLQIPFYAASEMFNTFSCLKIVLNTRKDKSSSCSRPSRTRARLVDVLYEAGRSSENVGSVVTYALIASVAAYYGLTFKDFWRVIESPPPAD
jgi:hypothetical protein